MRSSLYAAQLLHIQEGKHYGFPYPAEKATTITGVTQPLCRLTSAEGICYAPPGSFPTGYADSLYVASFADGNINRVVLTRAGDSYAAKAEFFAHVPSAIDVIISPAGVMYACSHNEKKVYRISSQ